MGFKAKSPASKPSYTGLQGQTSANNVPIPWIRGTNAVAPNLIWYDNFKSVEHKQRIGKGLGGGTTSTTFTYQADLQVALCEGPILGVGQIWVNKSVVTLADEGWTLFLGSRPQPVWDYIATHFAAAADNYNGIAHADAAAFNLGASATIGNHNFEILAGLTGSLSGVGNSHDADAALLIQDFLTDPSSGVDFPSAYLDLTSLLGGTGGSSFQCYCKAMGFSLSPSLVSQERASTILDRWLQLTNSTAIWSDGLLKFIPNGEDDVTAHGFHWVTPAAVAANLTDADFLATGDDPVKVRRIDVRSQPNILSLEISDRTNRYSKLPVEARDESAVNLYGPVRGSMISANEITGAAMAALSGLLIVRRGVYIRANYLFSLDAGRWARLEPMDEVTLTQSALGLAAYPVRLIDVEEKGDGTLQITAEDFVPGLSLPTNYAIPSTANNPVDQAHIAGNVNAPFIYEPPASLTGGVQEIWIGASSTDPLWGGAQIWISADGDQYSFVGTCNGKATQGTLTANLATFAGVNPDLAHTLSVDIAASGQTLASTSDANAQANAANLVVIGQTEIAAFVTQTLTGVGTYDLTRLYRGQKGTTPAAHTAGDEFAVFNDAIARLELPLGFVGRAMFVKLVSFNIWDAGLQDIATVTAYPFSPEGVVAGGPTAIPLLNRLALGQPADLGEIAGTQPWARARSELTVAPTTPIMWAADTPQLTGGQFIAPNNAAFKYFGSNVTVTSTVATPGRPRQVALDGPMPLILEFMYSGDSFEIHHSSLNLALWVDDQMAFSTGRGFIDTPQAEWRRFLFATPRQRKIKLVMQIGAFYGVNIDPAFTISAPPALSNARAIVMSDSFGVGGNATPWATGFVHQLGHMFDADLWPSCVGGTGYLSPFTAGGPGNYKFRDRLATDVFPYSPDAFLVFGGINDQPGIDPSYTDAAFDTEVAAFYASVASNLPGCRVVIGSCWSHPVTNGDANVAHRTNTLKGIALSNGWTFIDMINGVTYGRSGEILTNTGAPWFPDYSHIDTDLVHPTNAGHDLLAQLSLPEWEKCLQAFPGGTAGPASPPFSSADLGRITGTLTASVDLGRIA